SCAGSASATATCRKGAFAAMPTCRCEGSAIPTSARVARSRTSTAFASWRRRKTRRAAPAAQGGGGRAGEGAPPPPPPPPRGRKEPKKEEGRKKKFLP